jgi:hypothetical protein
VFLPRKELDVIISLTSFPKRFKYLHVNIRSLLANSVLPTKIILYLSKNEVDGVEIPKRLMRLCSDRFEIKIVDVGYRSFSKLLHALSDYPDKNIMTVDDDIIYSCTFLKNFVPLVANPDARIISGRCKEILLNDAVPYNLWPFKVSGYGHNLLLLGYSGVVYKPGSLHPDVNRHDIFSKFCAHNDDVWFTCLAKMAGVTDFYCAGVNDKKNKDIYSYHSEINVNNLSLENLHGRLETEFSKLILELKHRYQFNFFRSMDTGNNTRSNTVNIT